MLEESLRARAQLTVAFMFVRGLAFEDGDPVMLLWLDGPRPIPPARVGGGLKVTEPPKAS